MLVFHGSTWVAWQPHVGGKTPGSHRVQPSDRIVSDLEFVTFGRLGVLPRVYAKLK